MEGATETTPDAWSEAQWRRAEAETRRAVAASPDDAEAWRVLVRYGRGILRTYSTSFFIVTRFLPPATRDKVETIYAAVRYPDEVVDSFAWDAEAREAALDAWAGYYEQALDAPSLKASVDAGVPCALAPFVRVVRDTPIPPEHYRSFLDAMRLDIRPRPFTDLDDLIEHYVYGSAIVVGYFLTYVYGSTTPEDLERALESARNLGIALQLTNFVRDVREDQRRGRIYLPRDLLREEGLTQPDALDPAQEAAFGRVVKRVAGIAGAYYAAAERDLDAFAPACRCAIDACIRVYGALNRRIAASPNPVARRESVPFAEKFRVLPARKYWVLPLAYLRR